MYMNAIRLFVKNEKRIRHLDTNNKNIQTGYRNEIWGKCVIFKMKSGKREKTEGIELSNQERIRKLIEMEKYKYLVILEPDNIKQAEMKEKIWKDYLRQTRKHLETKFCIRNLTKEINTWAAALIKYWRLFLKWTRNELIVMG